MKSIFHLGIILSLSILTTQRVFAHTQSDLFQEQALAPRALQAPEQRERIFKVLLTNRELIEHHYPLWQMLPAGERKKNHVPLARAEITMEIFAQEARCIVRDLGNVWNSAFHLEQQATLLEALLRIARLTDISKIEFHVGLGKELRPFAIRWIDELFELGFFTGRDGHRRHNRYHRIGYIHWAAFPPASPFAIIHNSHPNIASAA